MDRANRVEVALRENPPGLWPFVPAGFPDIHATSELLAEIGKLPIRGIEIGIPYSDPIADGPIIQQAFAESLAAGVKLDAVFDCVSRVRASVDVPLLAMVSVSIVYRLGVETFLNRAQAAGLDGLIVPDLSLEEAPKISKTAQDAGLCLPMLVAPSTPPSRVERIAKAASGFLYYVAVQGTTGERAALPADLEKRIAVVRAATGLPTLVGFGIGTAAAVRTVCSYADGAIVGSAIVRRLLDGQRAKKSSREIIATVGQFVSELTGG